MAHMRLRRLRDLIPVSASALAFWAWANREEVVDWAAFGVRAIQQVVRGDREDAVLELRLRTALLEDRRTRRAPGLTVQVRARVAIFTGLVQPEVRDVAHHFAQRVEGLESVDDRLEVLPGR